MKRVSITILLIMVALNICSAQSERKSVRQGNRDFRKSQYAEAEIDYKKALVADSTSVNADYNLGNTYYRMDNFTEADKYYSAAADSLAKGKHGADVYHNMGNSFVRQKNYQSAVEAYKNALRRNPGDIKTKENLAYAQKMLQNQQNQDQNKDQNQDQNKDQNKDQNQDQNKDQNQDQNKDQNQDQNKDQNKDQNQDQNQDNKQGQSKITPQAAQQMLQAMQAQEKDTQDKVKKEKALRMKSKQKEKNW